MPYDEMIKSGNIQFCSAECRTFYHWHKFRGFKHKEIQKAWAAEHNGTDPSIVSEQPAQPEPVEETKEEEVNMEEENTNAQQPETAAEEEPSGITPKSRITVITKCVELSGQYVTVEYGSNRVSRVNILFPDGEDLNPDQFDELAEDMA